MAVRHDTRTIHTITVDIPDDIMGKLEEGDQVEVILSTRSGQAPFTISYSALRRLMGLGR